MAAVQDGVQHNLKKLQEQEADSVRRISEIERRLVDKVEGLVQGRVDEKMDQRLDAVESAVKTTLDQKLEAEVRCVSWAGSLGVVVVFLCRVSF